MRFIASKVIKKPAPASIFFCVFQHYYSCFFFGRGIRDREKRKMTVGTDKKEVFTGKKNGRTLSPNLVNLKSNTMKKIT